jgi:hypothetical protein
MVKESLTTKNDPLTMIFDHGRWYFSAGDRMGGIGGTNGTLTLHANASLERPTLAAGELPITASTLAVLLSCSIPTFSSSLTCAWGETILYLIFTNWRHRNSLHVNPRD